MTAQIQVELIGANGSRITEVKASGLTTRHVQTPRELVPSIFGDVKLGSDRKSAPKPISQPAPVSTPESPKQSLAELLAEVDAIMNPPPRLNTEPPRGHHYTEGFAKRKPNYDTPAIAYWDRVMQRKSDAEMAYRRKRAKAVA